MSLTAPSLHGKVALVTGAGQGVGTGIARALMLAGARVAVNDLVVSRAEAVAGELPGARACAFDVTDFEQTSQAVNRLAADGWPVDILVNNAGNAGASTFHQQRFADTIPAQWRGFVEVNLFGVLNCCHAVLPGMRERSWGRIITISSDAARSGLDIGVSLYGAAKAGAAHFMRHLACEVGPDGITCNTVSLGFMNNLPPEFAAEIACRLPMRRLGTPEDAGVACMFFALREAGWVTGQTLAVNGGSQAF